MQLQRVMVISLFVIVFLGVFFVIGMMINSKGRVVIPGCNNEYLNSSIPNIVYHQPPTSTDTITEGFLNPIRTRPIPKSMAKYIQKPNKISESILEAFEKRYPRVREENSFLRRGFDRKRQSDIFNMDKEELESEAHCSTYPWKPPLHGGLYKSCRFNNICLTAGGKWKLFMSKNNALKLVQHFNSHSVNRNDVFVEGEKFNPIIYEPEKPPIACHSLWDWLCFSPLIESKMEFTNETGKVLLSTTGKRVKLSPNFVWYTDQVVTMERAWIPINFGHALLEDIIPSISMLTTLTARADRPLFMTDQRKLVSTGTSVHHQSAINKLGLDKLQKLSSEWTSLITLGQPLALCNKNNIMEHPCVNDPESENDLDVLQGKF